MSSSSSSSNRPKRKYTDDDDDNDVEESDPQLSDEDDFEEREIVRRSPFYPANVSTSVVTYSGEPFGSYIYGRLFGNVQTSTETSAVLENTDLFDKWKLYKNAQTALARLVLRTEIDPVSLTFSYIEQEPDRRLHHDGVSLRDSVWTKVYRTGHTTIPRQLFTEAKSTLPWYTASPRSSLWRWARHHYDAGLDRYPRRKFTPFFTGRELLEDNNRHVVFTAADSTVLTMRVHRGGEFNVSFR